MRVWKVAVIRALAIANAFFVISGLYFLISWYGGIYDFGRLMPSAPYYAQAYYVRSLLNLGFLAALAVASVGIWRLKPSGRRLCNAVFVGEILYYVCMSTIPMTIWSCRGALGLLAQALAGTGGTGDMGIAYQSITGYPVIALVILNLAFPQSEQSFARTGGSTSKWGSLARNTGVLLGVVVGINYLGIGSRILITGGAKFGFGLVLWVLMVLGLFLFLPVSILGIFRPRSAAYSIAAVFFLLLATHFGGIVYGWVNADWAPHSLVWTLLLNILPPCAIAGLLFYAGGIHRGVCDVRD